MQVKADKVVSIDYTLSNDDGQVLDTSEGRAPLAYLHGRGNIIPGLEQAIEGKSEGDEMNVSIPPEQGYGEHREELVQQLPMEVFSGVDKVEPGMRFNAETKQGQITVMVTDVADGQVTVDANHELAGQDLHFAVKIQEVRDATDEELETGQVSG